MGLDDDTMLIDAAVHVWSDDPEGFPWSPLGGAAPPDHAATVEELEAALAETGFDGAVCIQPRVYGYDHRFLAKVLAEHPGRWVGVCLVDPADPVGPQELRRLVTECGISGVRLLAFQEESASWLAGSEGDPLWQEIEALGIPVNVLARPDQLADLTERARRHPDTTVVIDHLAMVVPAEDPDALAPLLACAEVGNYVAKLSALGFLSRRGYPYEDIHPMLRDVVSAFGAERVLFGTDWPNSRHYGPYPYTVQTFDLALDLGDTERALLMGGNAERIWPFVQRA